MGTEEIISIVIFCVLAVLLSIVLIIDFKNKRIVSQNSEKIKALIFLNKRTAFATIKSSYSNHRECNSKRQLDNFSIDDYLTILIDENESFYQHIIETISSNIAKYSEYIRETQSIKSTVTEEFCTSIGFPYKKFLWYEQRVFRSKTLRKPQVDIIVHCKVTYTSPKGRNHYWKEHTYHYQELKSFFDEFLKLKLQRQTRQYQIKVERAKMSDSLRYDILKRDNFRCQICGSSASDGVKLHVDHIIPVSRGGKTATENLRTLCDRCNMGKSDKV